MLPYYTTLKTSDGEELGLVQVYTPNDKQNIISYLVGTTQKGVNKLKIYKFSADSNIVGPMQLDKQIEEDEGKFNLPYLEFIEGIFDGRHRVLAAYKAGLTGIPCMIFI